MKLFLVRHGHYDNYHGVLPGRLPVKLSETGKRQICELRDYLIPKNIEKIYSSEVERCKETSEILADGRISVEYDKRLLEVLSATQGYWDLHGNPWQNFYSSRKTLGGESYKDVSLRVSDFYEDIINTNEKNIVVCSHGDVLYLLYCMIFGLDPLPETQIKEPGITKGYMHKGSLLEIHVESGKASVENEYNPIVFD